MGMERDMTEVKQTLDRLEGKDISHCFVTIISHYSYVVILCILHFVSMPCSIKKHLSGLCLDTCFPCMFIKEMTLIIFRWDGCIPRKMEATPLSCA